MCHRKVSISAYHIRAMILVAVGILCGCSISESESNTFKSYLEAKESGLIDRGWIPDLIPESAYDIKEQHRVDVPNINVELMFKPDDVATFEGACSLQEPNTYLCDNYGYPVRIVISGGNYAVIKSVRDGT